MSSHDTRPGDAPWPGYEGVPHRSTRMRPRRRAIARNLEASAAVPTLTADMQVDLTNTDRVRAGWPDDLGARPSLMAILCHDAARALREHPDLNASLDGDNVVHWDTVNLGVAVDTPGGLVVPVIRDAQDQSAGELTQKIVALADRARSGMLELTDLQAGTFTVSNPGSVGPSLRAEAFLNLPQVAILGLPGVRRVPLAVDTNEGEQVEIRRVINLSLSFDHRALDGGEAIRFLMTVRDRLEGAGPESYAAAATEIEDGDSA